MPKAKILEDYILSLKAGRFVASIKVYEVAKGPKFHDGIKLKCVLLDLDLNKARLLLDNHDPYGYHLHTKMPADKHFRVLLKVKTYEEAIRVFFEQARIIVDEK